LPSHIRISKAIDISASHDSVLQRLADPDKWKGWYPGADSMDLYQVNGRAEGLVLGEEGFTIIKTRTDSSVLLETTVKNRRKIISGFNVFPAGTPNTFTVQWYMDFHLRWYPWEKFSGMLLEKKYGPGMERSLDKLKTLLEENPEL
jgi:hypothetical protein